MDFENLIHERFSVRGFSGAAVEKEKLDKILEAGRIAPTARNSQSQRFRVVTDADGLAKIDECTPCRFGAPAVLIVCFDEKAAPHAANGFCTGETDAAITLTHMMLQAWEIGIGTCWVQHFDPEKLRAHFAVPKNLTPISLMPIGYAAPDCKTSPNHGKRMAIKDYMF